MNQRARALRYRSLGADDSSSTESQHSDDSSNGFQRCLKSCDPMTIRVIVVVLIALTLCGLSILLGIATGQVRQDVCVKLYRDKV